jgi:peptidoglycan/LPS O-acetylase OafA/YrhL
MASALKPLGWDELGVGLEISSAVLALAVAIYHFVQGHRSGRSRNPMTILARAAGLAILPQALIIMYATFDPSVLCHIQGLRVFFMLSGLSLVYVCIKGVTS